MRRAFFFSSKSQVPSPNKFQIQNRKGPGGEFAFCLLWCFECLVRRQKPLICSLMSFKFLDPGLLVDRELQLITPDPRLTDEVLRACLHPAGRGDPTAQTTRQQIEDYLRA